MAFHMRRRVPYLPYVLLIPLTVVYTNGLTQTALGSTWVPRYLGFYYVWQVLEYEKLSDQD